MKIIIYSSVLILGITLPYILFRCVLHQARRFPEISKKQTMDMGLILIGFILIDWGLFTALPVLKISFGPVTLPLLTWIIARSVIFAVWFETWNFFCVFHNNSHPIESEKLFFERVIAFIDRKVSIIFALLQSLLLLLLFYGFYYEPQNLQVTYVDIIAPENFPAQSLRIVQLSDLHVERKTRLEEEVISQVMILEPDLIVLTGDYLSSSSFRDQQSYSDTREILSQLQAPYGVFAISGNIDHPYTNQILFKDQNITLLIDAISKINIEGDDLYLMGISTMSHQRDAGILQQLKTQLPAEAFSILLYHKPNLVNEAAKAGIDLMLVGHTHGGQINLPLYGAIITRSDYDKRYGQGLFRLDQMWMYVSRGIGLEGDLAPRIRLFCPPEIVVIDLAKAQ